METIPTTDLIRRVMSSTHHEFFRILPLALAPYEWQQLPGGALVTLPHGTITIDISAERERRIALLKLTEIDLTIRFDGVEAGARSEFLRYFDARYQRGGG